MSSTTDGRVRLAATLAFFISLIASAPAATAATINIAWDANAPAENVVGYKVYVGTQSGVYASPVDVGNVTTYSFTSAVAGQTYFFAVSAYNASGANSPLSGEVSGAAAGPPDTTVPAVSITSPTSASTFSTSSSTVALGGTSSDNVGVTQVSYRVNGGASTNATGTTSWSVSSVSLQMGSNTIVVTARDAAGNTATDTLTVTRTDGTAPSITITSPTSASSFSTTAASINIGGSSSDNVGVTQVTWATNTGLSGTASGTTSWSVSGITLQSGSNIITVTSRDAAGNTGTDTLTVTASIAGTVTASSVSPSSGSGASQTFTFQFSDTAGGANITQAWVWLNATFASTSANSCMFYYDRPSNQLRLIDDAGAVWNVATPGVAGTLQNSSCAIALAGAGSTVSGNVMTLTVPVTFASPFAGTKNVYMYAVDAGGANSGWQTLGSWTVPGTAPLGQVSSDSSTPASGSGSSATFALKYSHASGAGNLAQTWVWFNATFASTSANSCMAYYNRATNEIFLIDDAGSTWNRAVLGTSGSLQNGSCAIALATSSATANANTLTVNLAMTFASSFAGGKNIYMYAADGAGNNSGWQTRGTWTVTSSTAAVTADSSTPNVGSGASQTFALKYSDTTGAASLTQGWVWFNATLASTSANSCMAYYDKPANTLSLINDAGTSWNTLPLGGGGTLQNSSCSIALGSTTTSVSGNTLTLNLAMTFAPGYAGAKNIYMYGADATLNSGWQDRGDWTVPSGVAAVTADSATPNTGSGSTQTFALRYSDTSGGVNLGQTWVWFNATFASTSANSCMVYYDKVTNQMNLINDAGTMWQSASLGVTGTLQNSSCAINLAASSVSISGNTLTLNLAMTFKPAFAGAKNIYMYGANATLNSGWQTRGTWTVP